MVRPKKESDVCDARVYVRMNAADKEALGTRARKTGLSLSEYLRRMGLRGEIVVRDNRVSTEEIRELNKIGVNLNQMTKVMNAGRDAFAPAVLATLARVNAYLDKATGL